MKYLLSFLSIAVIPGYLTAQKGNVPVKEMMTMSREGVVVAMDELVKTYGFSIAEMDAPKENTAQNSDSTVYFTWVSDDGSISSNVFYNSKIKNGVKTNLCSLTTTDSLWYRDEAEVLKSAEFKLSDAEIKSQDAIDPKVYNKDDYRIKIFSSYMGTDIKYYIIDVIWFGK